MNTNISIKPTNFVPKSYSQEPTETSVLTKTVKWFRGENLSSAQQTIRKVAAVALAVLLSMTLVGIYFVAKAVIEWKKQDQIADQKIQKTEKAEKAAIKILQEGDKEEEAKKAEHNAPNKTIKESIHQDQELTPQAEETIEYLEKQLETNNPIDESEEDTKLKAQQEAEEAAKLKAQQEAEEAAKLKAQQEAEEAAKLKAQQEAEVIATIVSSKQSDFPEPFQTLKKLYLDNPTDIDEILEKANKALKKGNGFVLPAQYALLEKSVVSEEQLSKLVDEAKVIAHHVTMRAFGEMKVKFSQYKMIFYTNLDMLFGYLNQNKSFPEDPFKWADTL